MRLAWFRLSRCSEWVRVGSVLKMWHLSSIMRSTFSQVSADGGAGSNSCLGFWYFYILC